MMPRPDHRVIALCALLALPACKDREIPTITLPRSSADTPSPRKAEPGQDLAWVYQFTVDVRTSGAFQPGEPIRIVATIEANLPADNAEIRITLPEVEAAQRSGWGGSFRLPVGVRLPPLLATRRPFAAGEAYQGAATITIPAPGYYRAVVTARSEDPVVADGPLIQNVSVTEVWLWVDEAGGRMTRTFDPALFPQGAVRQPGPLRMRHGRSENQRSAVHGGVSGSATLNSAAVSGKYYWEALYYNANYSRYDPVADAYWKVESYSEVDGSPVGTDWGYTDVSGRFYVDCVGSWDSYEGRVELRNGSVDVTGGGAHVSGAGYDECGNNVPYQTSAYSMHGHVYANISSAAAQARTFFGRSRGVVSASLDPNAENSEYIPDRITIRSTSGSDHVWGSYGRFVQAHEYGHAYHEKALGGDTGLGSCPPGEHYVGGAYNLQCALSEGFADYFATVLGFGEYDFEGTDYSRGCVSFDSNDNCLAYSSTVDGSIVEGAVASFYFDLTDAANEAHDLVQYPGSYLADIITTCQAYTSGWRRANGVDHIINCLEQTIYGYDRYFPTRDPDPTAISEGAAEPAGWNQSNIRMAWKKNLYNE